MLFSFRTSTGRLMLLVIVIAAELTLFQDVWQILVVPPITTVPPIDCVAATPL